MRNYILPLGALLILLVQAIQVSGEATPVRVVATVFGFVVLVLLLSGLNATMFQGAPEGSWRKRIPSIFLDVARFALIAVGVGMMFAYIWGANVGGLFTALGVSSIVLGLALQNSVGQIISGLLLLFEQPFQLGDWIDTPSARGRVVEVNWRATHIDTGSGMMIMPNSVLAAASFTNFSRPAGTHSLSVTTVFSVDDPPDDVMRDAEPGGQPCCRSYGRARRRPASVPAAWSTAQRSRCGPPPTTSPPNRSSCAGSGMPRAAPDCISTRPRTSSQHPSGCRPRCGSSRPTLRLNQDDQEELLPRVRLTRYGADEYIQYTGQVPKRMTFIVNGRVRLAATGDDGVASSRCGRWNQATFWVRPR